MGLFAPAKPDFSEEILTEIQDLKKEVAALKGEREATKDKKKLDEEYAKLKRELTDLQIDYDREKEKWEREKRETEHMVGLQRKRQEFEVSSAKTEATLTVREESLKADKVRFNEHVEFIEKRFDQQFDALNSLMEKFLERMPTTKQLITVGASNGAGEE